jgi:hypothetical protein
MGFFDGFSRRPGADSERLQKRDSKVDFLPRKVRIFHPRRAGDAAEFDRKWRSAGDLLERDGGSLAFSLAGQFLPPRGLCNSADVLRVWRDHGLADVVLAFNSISAGY